MHVCRIFFSDIILFHDGAADLMDAPLWAFFVNTSQWSMSAYEL